MLMRDSMRGAKVENCKMMALRLSSTKFNRGNCGFTLLELLVVVAIIGVLASIGAPLFTKTIDVARNTRTMSEIRTLEASVATYFLDKDAFPATLSDVGFGDLRDPFGNLYQYTNIQGGGAAKMGFFLNQLNNDYDLYSLGEDGSTDADFSDVSSQNDIIRASDGGFVGMANKINSF